MTVELRRVSKTYHTTQGPSSVLKRIDFRVEPGERVGILGQNGAGKSTLIRILGGSEQPTEGNVVRNMSVSWPLAFGGAFLGALTGIDNVRFVCRLYGIDPAGKMEFVEAFTELGRYLREPVKTYSSGMRARLAFAVSMAIDFDCYLVDEIVAVGDDRFQRKCQVELFEKRRDKAMLIVSHSADFVRRHCDRASVLAGGHLTNFDDVEEGYLFYSRHEVSIQAHMSEKKADGPSHLMPNAVDFLAKEYAAAANPAEFQEVLSQSALHRVPVIDSCDVVGRLENSGQSSAAMAIARYLGEEVSTEPLFKITLGDLLSKRRLHVPAVEAYERAIELDPDSFWAHRNLATEMFNVGRYSEAIPHYERALGLISNDADRLELQLRWSDCHFLLDRAESLHLVAPLPAGKCHVVDQSVLAVPDGGPARMYVNGLVMDGDVRDMTCLFTAGSLSWPGRPIFAQNSVRRLARIAEKDSFGFVSYADLPANVSTVSVELRMGQAVVYRASCPVHGVGGNHFEGADALVLARRASSEHQHAVSALYYGLCEFDGPGADRVPFAEHLVGLGHYDEAQWWLHQWINDPDTSETGLLLDLLCAEIARSRLPGWHEDIEKILTQTDHPGARMSVLANLGHSRCAYGDIRDAVRFYAEAATIRSDAPQIHFASGIYSAQHALELKPPEAPAGISGERQAEVVHLFACDANYFARFGEKLVTSSVAAREDCRVLLHAHIIDPTAETRAIAAKLGEAQGVRTTFEDSPAHLQSDRLRRAYYTCARFLAAPSLIRQYASPVIVTEADALVNWRWKDIVRYIGDADVGYAQAALWNWVPWTKIPAGLVYFGSTQAGLATSEYVAAFIEHAFAREDVPDLWTVDQAGLWLAHINAPRNIRRVHLPMYSVLTLATGDKLNI